MVVQLPLTPVQSHFQVLSVPFDAAMQLSYRQAVADASGLSLDNIQIRSITAVTDGVAVETLILAQVVPLSLTTNNLNGHLVALGLPPAVLLTPPVLKLFPIISEDLEGPIEDPSRIANPDKDCLLEGGMEVTLHCPYEDVLMEHCYKCYDFTYGEVILCDGWSSEDIWAQCYSPDVLPSPSAWL